MRTFEVKGCVLGVGRPKTIVSVMGRDGDASGQSLVEQARAAVAAGADCIELRADSVREADDSAAMAALVRELGATLPHTPLVFTFRSAGQGGLRSLDAGAYAELNRAVIACGGADVVDIEAGIGDVATRELVDYARSHDVGSIVSHHDFAGTPPTSEMVERLVHMARLGADIPKLAVMAHSELDALRLMEATAQARSSLDMPLVTMAMGKAGALTRLAGEATGSALTFCALGTASAPGQVELGLASRCLDDLHEALGIPSGASDAAKEHSPEPGPRLAEGA